MKNNFLIAAILAALLRTSPVIAAPPQLKYVVIVSRHGVRAPTWEAARLNQYSAEPWPNWGVPPGDLTPHGRALIKLMGAYYRDWLLGEHLFNREGCQDAGRIYIWADVDQRTLETGRAFAESLAPGCGLAIHSRPNSETDPLFSGYGTPNPELSLKAVREQMGPEPQKILAEHHPALEALQFILTGGQTSAKRLILEPAEIRASIEGKSVDLQGPFSTGSTLSEDLQLEYTNGMEGADLGWGRLTQENLFRVLEIHAVYSDLIRRTPYVARARGSNLLTHILQSIEQAAAGKAVPGALDQPGGHVLLLAGHDTNQSNISGMLGLSWHLQGYQRDDTPPGGALLFSLWEDSGKYFVRTQYIAQALDQMRKATPLTTAAPPEKEEISIPGCDIASQNKGCSWPVFKKTLEQAIDPSFVSVETGSGGAP